MGYWGNVGDKLINNIIGLTNPTWQQLFLVLGLIAIFLFRHSIAKIIMNIKKIGREGVEFLQSTPSPSMNEELGKIQTTFGTITSLNTITTNLSTIQQYLRDNNLTDPARANNFLERELADVYFILRCERVYNIIFGSQIALLKKLLQSNHKGLTLTEVENHFNVIAKMHPELYSNWNTAIYINFLIQWNLIMPDRDSYRITDFGADFLTWLQRTGFPENKYF